MDYKRIFWILFILWVLGIFPAMPYIFPKWFEYYRSATEITVFINYEDNCLLGVDTAIEGFEYVIYDESNLVLFGFTDATGTIVYYNIEGYTSLTIWGVGEWNVNLDGWDLSEGMNDINIPTSPLDADIRFTHDNSLAINYNIDLYFGATFIGTYTTDSLGHLSVNGLFKGEWFLDGVSFNVAVDEPYTNDIVISAEDQTISIINNIQTTRKSWDNFFFFYVQFTFINLIIITEKEVDL